VNRLQRSHLFIEKITIELGSSGASSIYVGFEAAIITMTLMRLPWPPSPKFLFYRIKS